MPEHRDNLTPQQRLMAYVDGELDADAALVAMRQISADPTAARLVEQELRLRQSVARAIDAEPGPSDDLVRKVAAMSFQMPSAADMSTLAPGIRWIRMGIAACIAMLGIGVLIGRFALTSGPAPITGPGVGITPVAEVMPAEYIKSATQVHVRCSRGTDHHAGEGWPADVAGLEEPFRQYINNQDLTYPDLSSIGFKYVGCASCGRPQQQGVHLMYRSVNGADTLSLFVEPYKNQVNLPPNACRYCPRSDVHPVLVWRTDNLVFFFVGNAKTPVEKARQAMKLPDPI